MKPTAKLIVLHPSLYKQQPPPTFHHHRFYLLIFLSLTSLTLLLTLLKHHHSLPPPTTTATSAVTTTVNHPISAALLHYATTSTVNSSAPDRMSSGELSSLATALRLCPSPCNFLVFGLTHETLLWLALNHPDHGGRTVFLDENQYLVEKFERNFTGFEGYDVQYTTKVSKAKELIHNAREERKGECRPVQNLLFSDCKLAINDLPNHLYEIPWDLILIDGPRGYSGETPGRMAAIFSAAVMGRSKRGDRKETHVFVHDFGREVERVFSEEFLCRENLVEEKDSLAHFVVKTGTNVGKFEFCTGEGNEIMSS